ncbi:MAG: protein kinase [Pirellulaceae bacterium]|nr:protein kinase [Pirellulaceae bacterium]
MAKSDRPDPRPSAPPREAVPSLDTDSVADATTDWRTGGGAAGLAPSSCVDGGVPRAFGRYRILERVGSGGMGTVYSGLDPELDRQVAVKVPHFQGSNTGLARQRFLREARAAAKVRHPHICPIYDVGQQEGIPFVVMAFVHGRSLAETFKCQQMPEPRQAVLLVSQLLEALRALHAAGIIHRDLKPGNVLLDQDGRALLTDFGLAQSQWDQAQLTAPGGISGTPSFMSPEQARGEPLDERTDIYSLGVVLYWLLSGQLPFHGSALEVLHQVASQAPPSLSEVSPGIDAELEAIVRHATAHAVEQRYADAGSFQAALETWLANHSGSPASHPFAGQRVGWRRYGSMIAAAAVILAVALAAATIWWRSMGTARPAPETPTADQPTTAPATAQTPVPPTLPLTGEFQLRVWDDLSKQGIAVDQPGALPIHNGDGLRLDVRLSEPAFVYIVWVDASGATTPVYPWNPIEGHTWATPRPVQRPASRLFVPSLELREGFIADGPPGLDTVVMCARRTPLPVSIDLRPLLGNISQAEFHHESEVVWLELRDDQPTAEYFHRPMNRGIQIGESKKLDEPIVDVLRRLTPHFELVQAVRFARVAAVAE